MSKVATLFFFLTLLAVAATAGAADLGTARVTAVAAVNGGCVAGPTGPWVQAWDVAPGYTYKVTLTHVTDCAEGGSAPTLNVRLNNSDWGNTDLVATRVAAGTYEFQYAIPAKVTCTLPIFYGTTPGQASTGLFARRADGGATQTHLRASFFAPGCTYAVPIPGPSCGAVPTSPRTWGEVKIRYH